MLDYLLQNRLEQSNVHNFCNLLWNQLKHKTHTQPFTRSVYLASIAMILPLIPFIRYIIQQKL